MSTPIQKLKSSVLHLVTDAYVRLFATPRWAKANIALFRLSLNGLGVLNNQDFKVSGEDYLIRSVLPTMITSEEPVLLDVGANQGDYSLALKAKFANAKVYSFEPHPRSFQRLEVAARGQLVARNMALGSAPGTFTLFDRVDVNGSSHASLYREVISQIHKQEVVATEVTVETLDRFAAQEGIDYVDFLKIDTEGNDLAVLQGAESLLREGRIGCIHFEFNEMNVVSRVFFRDFRLLLEAYTLFRLLPEGLLKLPEIPLLTEIYAYQNIFAVPNDKILLLGRTNRN